MGRAKRNALRRIALWLRDLSEWSANAADRLEDAASRRARPLRFENDSERMLREIAEHTLRHYAEDVLHFSDEIWRDVPHAPEKKITFNRLDLGEPIGDPPQIKIRLPTDG